MTEKITMFYIYTVLLVLCKIQRLGQDSIYSSLHYVISMLTDIIDPLIKPEIRVAAGSLDQ